MSLFSTLNISANVHDLALADFGIAVSWTRPCGQAPWRAILGNNGGIGVVVDSVSAKGMVNVERIMIPCSLRAVCSARAVTGAVINNSWTDVSVTAEARGRYRALCRRPLGMGGNNNMAIVNAAAFGQVWGSTPQGDSLVGRGRLVGMYPGRLWNSYATGDVTYDRLASSLHTWAGALAGQ